MDKITDEQLRRFIELDSLGREFTTEEFQDWFNFQTNVDRIDLATELLKFREHKNYSDIPYVCCACEYKPENFDPANGEFDCPKCGCEMVVNDAEVIQTITALRARIEELTIPAHVRDTLIYSMRYITSKCWTDKRFTDAIDWLTAYKEAQG